MPSLDRNTIPLVLKYMGKDTPNANGEAPYSDASSYAQMSATWRGDGGNSTPPSEADMNTNLTAMRTDDTSGWADNVRATRNRLLAEADCLAIRHRDQVDNSETTDLSGAQYTELLDYKKALRDLPANIVATANDTIQPHGTFDAPVYPTKPNFMS